MSVYFVWSNNDDAMIDDGQYDGQDFQEPLQFQASLAIAAGTRTIETSSSLNS